MKIINNKLSEFNLDTYPSYILKKIVEKKAKERSSWIDSTIIGILPKWKLDLLKICNYQLIRKLIGANIEIINQTIILDRRNLNSGLGTQITIKLNGKVIGDRKFT